MAETVIDNIGSAEKKSRWFIVKNSKTSVLTKKDIATIVKYLYPSATLETSAEKNPDVVVSFSLPFLIKKETLKAEFSTIPTLLQEHRIVSSFSRMPEESIVKDFRKIMNKLKK